MNIVLVQFYPYHEEVLAPQINFLHHDEHKLYIAAPESVFKNDYLINLKEYFVPVLFKNTYHRKFSFFFRIFSILKKYKILFKYHNKYHFDMIIFNTITKNFHYYLINKYFKNIKKIQIIHNSYPIIKNKGKYLKLFYMNLFLSRDIHKYFLESLNLDNDDNLTGWFCPLLSDDNINKKNISINFNDSYINIVIPGVVNEERRNYNSLFNALEKYRNNTHLKFKVYLLGKISKEMIDKLINKGINDLLTYYTEFVSGDDMLNCIKNADAVAFLLDSKLGDNFSYYNKNKVSGNTNLCLSFGTPCIVSDEYLLENALKNKAIIYPNDNIDIIFDNIENGIVTKESLKELRSLNIDSQYSFSFQKKQYLKALGLTNAN